VDFATCGPASKINSRMLQQLDRSGMIASARPSTSPKCLFWLDIAADLTASLSLLVINRYERFKLPRLVPGTASAEFFVLLAADLSSEHSRFRT